MDLWVTLGVLVRRWYLTIPLIGAVVFGALSVANSLKPLYTADATVRFYCPAVVQDPNDPNGEIPNNELCNDRAVFDLTGDVGQVMKQRETIDYFEDRGLLGNYLVDDTKPPRLTITAEADDPEVVVESVRTAARFVQSWVVETQTSPWPYTAAPLGDLPQEAEEISAGRIRTLITIIVAGIIFTVLLVHVIDALLVLWRRRREGGDTGHPLEPASPAPTAPAAVAATPAPWIERSVPQAQDPAATAADEEPGLTAVSGGRSRWGR